MMYLNIIDCDNVVYLTEEKCIKNVYDFKDFFSDFLSTGVQFENIALYRNTR